MEMLGRLVELLPHPLSSWITHARSRASYLEKRRDVNHVGEEIRDALDRMDDPPDVEPPTPAETGPEYRDTVLARYDDFGEFVRRELETAAAERVSFRPQTHFLCTPGISTFSGTGASFRAASDEG